MKKRILIILPIILIIVLSIAYFKLIKTQKDSSTIIVSGNIEIVDVKLSFKISGKLMERLKDEGELVKKGEIIAKLDPIDQEIMVSQAEANLLYAKTFLEELEAGSRKEEIKRAGARVDQARFTLEEMEKGSRIQEIAASKAELDRALASEKMSMFQFNQAKPDYDRYKDLYKQDKVSIREYEAYQTKYDTAKSAYDEAKARVISATEVLKLREEGSRVEQIKRAKAGLSQAEAEYELVKQGARKETIEQAKAKLISANESLRQAKQVLEYTKLYSPIDGVVLSKSAEPGEFIGIGSTILTVGNLDKVFLRAYINEPDLGKIKLNKEVLVTTDSYPDKKFKGRISFISSEAEFTPKTVQTFEERVKLMYRIKVELENPQYELKAGMPADAFIKIE